MTEASEIYYPSGTEVLGINRFGKALLGVMGASGSGKSHLGNQLLRDPEYGKDEVLFMMAEDATATYDMEGIRLRQVRTFDSAMEVANDLARATVAGKRLPKVIFVDSLSGMADYQRQSYKENSNFKTAAGERDKRAEFGDLGYSAIDLVIRLRDAVAADVVVLATTFEGVFNAAPEIAIEGRLVPKNITRLTSLMLYLKAFSDDYDPAQITPKPKPHRQIVSGQDANGKQFHKVINRYFFTQNVGEVIAKGHHALAFQEPAYLPDILRRVHGKQPLYA